MNQPTDCEKMELYDRHQGIARRLAYKFARTYHTNQDDMLEEAQFTLAKAATTAHKTHDVNRSAESTWIYNNIYYHLLTVCTRKRDKITTFSEIENPDNPIDVHARFDWLTNFTKMLGEEAKVLVKLIVDAPLELTDDLTVATRARGRKAVRNYLKQMGWSPRKVERVWNEVTVCLSDPN